MTDTQTTDEGTGTQHGDTGHLPLGTFREAGAGAPTARADIDSCALGVAAHAIGRTALQTARMFSWATGATAQRDITPDEVARFAALLPLLGARFGTHVGHFELPVNEAIAQARGAGLEARDRTTIARHVHRLPLIRDKNVPLLEHRLGPDHVLSPTIDETDRIEGWVHHRVFVVVEQRGIIRCGAPLDSFESIADAANRSRDWGTRLVDHATEELSRLQMPGRACVATSHHGRLRLIDGFWVAARSKVSADADQGDR